MAPLRVGISGAAGRMGKRLVALSLADPELELVAALESDGHPAMGKDAGLNAGEEAADVALSVQLNAETDVLIDFSVPDGAVRAVTWCRQRRTPLVMATTGLDDAQRQLIHAAAAEIPVVLAPSMSMAVNLTMKLAAMTARTLRASGIDVDVEIIERHHRFKEDAPSGTALKFGELIAQEMGITHHQHGREGRPGIRPRDEIGYHALRTGDNAGEHTMVFGMLGETIELSVRASNRDCYAAGALAAAKYVAEQAPGLYDMFDVLGLTEA